MTLGEFIFGRRPDAARLDGLKVIEAPPGGARLRKVRPKPGAVVRAEPALKDGAVATEQGELHYQANRDCVIEYDDGGRAVVRADIFEATYKPLGDGRFEKRTDITLHYFTLRKPVLVRTMEGLQRAEAGDWIMQGVKGELWPVSRAKALESYSPV